MCSLFGLIDHQNKLTTREKNRILNTLARECEVRGTDATGIAPHFGGRLRIFTRPLPARKLREQGVEVAPAEGDAPLLYIPEAADEFCDG